MQRHRNHTKITTTSTNSIFRFSNSSNACPPALPSISPTNSIHSSSFQLHPHHPSTSPLSSNHLALSCSTSLLPPIMDLSPLDPHFHKHFSKKLGISLSELRVLIIVDSSSYEVHLSTLLNQSGYSMVDHCTTSSEAMHLLHTSTCSTIAFSPMYSFILCDCTLAPELLSLVTTSSWLSHIPFIVLANLNQLELASKALLLGADDCLFRPFNGEVIKSLWKHIWRKKRFKNLWDSNQEEKLKSKKLEERHEALVHYLSCYIRPFLDETNRILQPLFTSVHSSTMVTDSIRSNLHRLFLQFQSLPSLTSLLQPSSKHSFSSSFSSSSSSFSSSSHLKSTSFELPSLLPNPSHIALLQHWNFNVFQYTHSELLVFFLEFFIDLDLLEPFHISPRTFYEFLISVEKGYSIHPNPYHHFRHAFDVTQAAYLFLKACSIPSTTSNSKPTSKTATHGSQTPSLCNSSLPSTTVSMNCFNKLEQFAFLLACVCHDLEHDGKTNQFHIKTGSELAFMFNDQSPLENLHTKSCFKLLHQHHLWSVFSSNQQQQLRTLIIQCILATDMTKHNDIVQRFQSLSSSSSSSTFDWNQPSHRSQLLEMLMKCADVSNVLRPLPLAQRWAELIQEEMFRLGDLELGLGVLPLSLYCDRREPQLALLSKNFSEKLCSPMFHTVSIVVPQLQPYFHGLKETQAYWNNVLQKDKTNSS